MSPEVQRLFELAVELPEQLRAEFLEREGLDAAVRKEVESLLSHDGFSESILQDAIRGAASSLQRNDDFAPGDITGSYRILSLLGRGGMGAVYLAERADGAFNQRVAIKVVGSASPPPFLLERFHLERQILARLNHPYIARLLDGGQMAGGRPYLVMEYVSGSPIDSFCDSAGGKGGLAAADRIRLFLKVCDAVLHAHQHLIVHRDLKPANILVTAGGEPKLLDFGIAKILDPSQLADTRKSTQILTLEYTSPEQVRGDPITTAADLYSLGAVLYRLITGQMPHAVEDLSPLEAARVVSEQEVRPASAVRPGVAADLDAILEKALRKDPERRYRSVEEFASDLRRYLEGRPVLASPDTFWYRASKFLRRYWIPVTATVSACLLLLAATGVAILQARRAERRFAQVYNMANTILFDVEQSIRPLAGSTPSRRLVVDTGKAYLESLAQEAKGDPALTRGIAAAFRKVGDIQGDPAGANLGDVAGALQSYRRAVDLLDSLGDKNSADPGHSRAYVDALTSLAASQIFNGDLTGAGPIIKEASSLSELLLQRLPLEAETLIVAARVYVVHANLLSRGPNSRGALEMRLKAIELQRQAAALLPSAGRDLPEMLSAAGIAYERLGDFGKAIENNREAISTAEVLVKGEPANALHRRRLMIALTRLSLVMVRSPKTTSAEASEAEALARRAARLAEASTAADPTNARALSDLMATTNRLAYVLDEKGDLAGALETRRAAVQAADELLRRDPADQEALLNRALCHGWYGESCAKAGRLAEAIRERRLAEKDLDRLTAGSPGNTRFLVAQATNWMDLGKILLRANDRLGATEPIRRGLELGDRLSAADASNQEIRAYLKAFREETGRR